VGQGRKQGFYRGVFLKNAYQGAFRGASSAISSRFGGSSGCQPKREAFALLRCQTPPDPGSREPNGKLRLSVIGRVEVENRLRVTAPF